MSLIESEWQCSVPICDRGHAQKVQAAAAVPLYDQSLTMVRRWIWRQARNRL